MPLYVYRCEDCGSQFEKRQSFSDEPLTVCESCHGRLRKLLQPSTIIYKGSGFYSTDYRSKSGGNGRNGAGAKEETGKGGSESSDTQSKDSGKAGASADKG